MLRNLLKMVLGILFVSLMACSPSIPPIGSGGSGTGDTGYPDDFPKITGAGGLGAGGTIWGFGGDTTTDKAGNRAQVTRTCYLSSW